MKLLAFVILVPSLLQALVDEPKACYRNQVYPCAIRVTNKIDKFELKGLSFYAAKGASFVLSPGAEIRLLEGDLWITFADKHKIQTGPVDFVVSGESWLQKNSKGRITVYNLLGEVQVDLGSSKSTETIPVGFKNWFDGVMGFKEVNRGVISPIEPKKFLKDWAKMESLTKKKQIEKIQDYKEAWRGNIEEASQLYSQIIERRVANINAKKEQEYLERQRIQKQKDQLRNLFRQRFYNP